MSRWPLLLLTLLACAVGLAACGDDATDADPAAILAETFGEGKEVESGRLDLSFRLDAEGLQRIDGPVALRLDGPFQSTAPEELPRFDFRVAIEAGPQTLELGAVSTGDKGFLRLGEQAYAVSDELFDGFREGYAEQAKCNDRREGGVSLATLGVDPERWLRAPEVAGEEEVGGVDTTHITAGIDVPRFLEDVNRILGRTEGADPCAEGEPREDGQDRRLDEEERRQIAGAIQDARVDVWSGVEDRMLRRLNVELRFDVPEESRERLGGLESGDLRFDLTLAALNEDQTIEAPQDAKPLDDLVAQLGGAIPGLGAGAPGGGAGEQASEYAQCVEDAGGDVQQLQECAELIGR